MSTRNGAENGRLVSLPQPSSERYKVWHRASRFLYRIREPRHTWVFQCPTDASWPGSVAEGAGVAASFRLARGKTRHRRDRLTRAHIRVGGRTLGAQPAHRAMLAEKLRADL